MQNNNNLDIDSTIDEKSTPKQQVEENKSEASAENANVCKACSDRVTSDTTDREKEILAYIDQDKYQDSPVTFINKTQYTKRVVRDYCFANTLRPPISIIYLVSLLLILGTGLGLALGTVDYRIMGICFIVISLVFVPFFAVLGNVSMGRALSKKLSANGSDFQTIFSFGSRIVIRNTKTIAVSLISYEEIKCMYSFGQAIILRNAKGSAFIISKNGFLRGDEKAFKTFIKEIITANKHVKKSDGDTQ